MPETGNVCKGSPVLTKTDRDKIASRIHSLLFWVGEVLPQEIVIEDRKVKLRDVVFNYLMKENPTEEERRDATALADMLDRHVHDFEREIKHGTIDRSQACDLMNEARTYLRAVDELRNVTGKDAEIKRRDLMLRVEDERRWKKFLDDVK